MSRNRRRFAAGIPKAPLGRKLKEAAWLMREHRKPGARCLVEVMPICDAMVHARYKASVAELLTAASASASGMADVPMECFCCARPWTALRFPLVMVAVEFLASKGRAVLSAVCNECCDTGKAREMVFATLKRDFDVDDTAIQLVHDEVST